MERWLRTSTKSSVSAHFMGTYRTGLVGVKHATEYLRANVGKNDVITLALSFLPSSKRLISHLDTSTAGNIVPSASPLHDSDPESKGPTPPVATFSSTPPPTPITPPSSKSAAQAVDERISEAFVEEVLQLSQRNSVPSRFSESAK